VDSSNKIYASFWLRFLAVAVDWVFVTIIAVLFRMALSFASLDPLTILDLFIVFYVFFTFSYNTFCIYKFGATLGKRFAGIEVVKEEGAITLFETLRREALLKPVSIFFFGIGIITMFFNPKRQTHYDKKLHLVVLVRTPLSFTKRIFAFLIGFAFAVYLSTWTPFIYGILNIKNEQMKRDMIDGLTQKREIMDVINNPEEEKFMEYYKKKNTPIKEKINELCAKRFLKIIDKKTTCTFEDLSLTALMEVNKLYEDAITGFLDVQTQVQDERSKRFAAASSPSPTKLGWMRYTDLNNEYYLDYPKTFLVRENGKNSIIFEKNIVTEPHGVDYYIFIQKGESFQWKKEEIESLKKMVIGEKYVMRNKENSLPSKFLTYERLQNLTLGDKKIKAFINRSVWEFPEGTLMHVYLYEGKSDYIFGGLTDEAVDNKDNISLKEFKDIISTINFYFTAFFNSSIVSRFSFWRERICFTRSIMSG